MTALQWVGSDNPCFRLANYKGIHYYLRLSLHMQFRAVTSSDGQTDFQHVPIAYATLFTGADVAIGLQMLEQGELGVMACERKDELLNWIETGQEWAESVLLTPMQRLVQQLTT